jgi:hypothetical protein
MSEQRTKEPPGASGDHRQDVVTVIINGVEKPIHRGRQSVKDIKTLGGVPEADELEQVINGKLTPLADGAAVTIKGGEEFVSHPRDSGSSHA